MKVYKASTSKKASEFLLALKNKVYFKTNFHHLAEHNGLRPGKMHMALGTTSAGKSTWVRGIINDFVVNNPKSKILLYLSEESFEDLRLSLYTCNLAEDQINKVLIVSELSNNRYQDEKEFLVHLEELIAQEKPELFIFDNLTTSRYYNDLKTKDQENVASSIKRITIDYGCATLLVAHTKKDVNTSQHRLIQIEDVRGSSTLPNLLEFAYVLQHFFVDDNRYSMIRIAKHRGYDVRNSTFALLYDNQKQIIYKDRPIGFSELKLNFKDRDKL